MFKNSLKAAAVLAVAAMTASCFKPMGEAQVSIGSVPSSIVVDAMAESEEMRSELMDRFGTVPKSVENILRISLIRVQAHGLFVTEVKGKNERIQIYMKPDADIDPAKIPALLSAFPKKLNFVAKGNPYFVYKYKKLDLVEKDAEQLLSLTEEILTKMDEILFTI